jgi:hypothetical protein
VMDPRGEGNGGNECSAIPQYAPKLGHERLGFFNVLDDFRADDVVKTLIRERQSPPVKCHGVIPGGHSEFFGVNYIDAGIRSACRQKVGVRALSAPDIEHPTLHRRDGLPQKGVNGFYLQVDEATDGEQYALRPGSVVSYTNGFEFFVHKSFLVPLFRSPARGAPVFDVQAE